MARSQNRSSSWGRMPYSKGSGHCRPHSLNRVEDFSNRYSDRSMKLTILEGLFLTDSVCLAIVEGIVGGRL
jgi:hypothetical protein